MSLTFFFGSSYKEEIFDEKSLNFLILSAWSSVESEHELTTLSYSDLKAFNPSSLAFSSWVRGGYLKE